MNQKYIMKHTANEIAQGNNVNSVDFYSMIGAFTGLSIDEIADRIGDNDIADMTGAEIADAMENAFASWYDREKIERPGYTPAELAADMVIYTAWQINEG